MDIIRNAFGSDVRFQYDESTNQVLVHMMDFAKVLMLPKTTRDVVARVFTEWRFNFSTGSVGASSWWLSEPGAYQLLFSSRHPKAVEIQKWVFEDVLPSIRKQGFYVDPNFADKDLQIKMLTQEIANLKASNALAVLSVAETIGDDRLRMTATSSLANSLDESNGYTTVSECLEHSGYRIHRKAVGNTLSMIGRKVKAAYIEETGHQPQIVIKQVDTSHNTDIKYYPLDYADRIVAIALEYWGSKDLLEEAV